MSDAPAATLGLCANVFTRMMHFARAGETELGHTHPYDHLTLLARGSLSVEVNGETTDFAAPHMIYIRAEHRHKLIALEDETIAFCIHALRDGIHGDILDPSMIPKGSKARDYGNTVAFVDAREGAEE